MKPYRFIAKLPSKGTTEEERCGYAYVANDDRDRLTSTPKTVWKARVTLTDPFGRRLVHNGPLLEVRLDNNPLIVCVEDGAAPPPRTDETRPPQWKGPPKIVIGGLFPSHPLRKSDLLLVDLEAAGPTYLLITVRDADNPKGTTYPFQAMIDPSGVVEHGCAAVAPPIKSADISGLHRLRTMKRARMEIVAMDYYSGRTTPAPDTVVWTPTRNGLAVCLPGSVAVNQKRFSIIR